ncbi:MAG TPA: Amuc_1100 family pilus-like protein [Verrucomicrobiae bacterium]|nr:Amuc_1100 family pilus-like protein [Verrucomicrobiae bacterium]
MNWIKKNLFLVVGGLIALALLAVAGWFWYTRKAAVDQVTAELNEQTAEFQRLMTRDPHPNQDNIEAARKEQERLTAFLGQARQYFIPAVSFTNLDKETFKGLLETTIFELVRDAEKAGVNLPGKYDFTFKTQRGSVVFAPETLMPLATQVAEIKALCDVLFRARVHSLVSLRRIPVAKEDEGSIDFLSGRKPVTNAVTGAITTPYEIVFQGFSAELAGVLDGFYRATNCFIVKNIDVQTNVTVSATEPVPSYQPFSYTAPAATPTPTAQPSYDALMRQRYGIGNPYRGIRPGEGVPSTAAPVVPVTPTRRGPETVLDEKPLKFTMYLESVRLSPTASSKAAN